MEKPFEASPQPTSNQLAQQRTSLAFDRTFIAGERTMMAWVRTSLSMIGFGFTIFKFFQYMEKENIVTGLLHKPRNLALALIGLGTVSLLAAELEYVLELVDMKKRYGKTRLPLALIVAVILSVIGGMAFIDTLFKVGPF